MWIKRKEYEEMKNMIIFFKQEIDDLKKLNRTSNLKLNSLISCHNKKTSLTPFGELETISHEIDKIYTNKVSDLTLQELAQYVIDGKPIVREETIKVKKVCV